MAKNINLAQKSIKVSKAISIFVKESKAAKAAGTQVKKFGKWWSDIVNSRVTRNGERFMFHPTVAETKEAAEGIMAHRQATGFTNLEQKNFGYLEGSVNSSPVDSKMWMSEAADPREVVIFDVIQVGTWVRNTDSEYKMLTDMAKKLGAKKGDILPNMSGELKIVSELEYCDSCIGVIKQFHEMFPNIKLALVDGVRNINTWKESNFALLLTMRKKLDH